MLFPYSVPEGAAVQRGPEEGSFCRPGRRDPGLSSQFCTNGRPLGSAGNSLGLLWASGSHLCRGNDSTFALYIESVSSLGHGRAVAVHMCSTYHGGFLGSAENQATDGASDTRSFKNYQSCAQNHSAYIRNGPQNTLLPLSPAKQPSEMICSAAHVISTCYKAISRSSHVQLKPLP